MNRSFRHRSAIGALAGVIAFALASTPAAATPPVGVSVEPISNGVFPDIDLNAQKSDKWDIKIKAKDVTDVRVARVTIAAGGELGWHSHPGVSLVAVLSGSVVNYHGDDPLCTGVTVHAGETFTDLGGDHVHNLRNESSEPVVLVPVGFFPHGAVTTISQPEPNNCRF